VGRRIAELIALPAGQRPLKVIMGAFTEGFGDLLQMRSEFQRNYSDALGFGALLQRQPAGVAE
jgi:hypothetical protein